MCIRDSNDTSPQLGGNLDTNSHEISLDTSHAINFGDSNELRVFYHSGNGQIDFNGNTSLQLKTPANKYFQVVNRDNGNNIIQAQAGGAVQIYHNNTLRFETRTNDVKFYDGLVAIDNAQIQLGNSGDLKLYHDGTNSYVDNIITGILRIRGNSSGQVEIQPKGGQYGVTTIPDGAVELYHNGTKQVETSTDGLKFPSGKGINFASGGSSDGPSVSSELLDDYEEGSWTATLNGHSSPTNTATNNPTTSRTATGHYRKIGSYVHAQATWANLQQSGANDMANHQIQTITGLPFTSMGTLFTSELGYSRGIYGRYNNAIIEEAIFYFSLSGSSTTVYPNASQIVQNSPGTLYHVVSNSNSSMYYSFQMSYYTT